MWDDKCMSPPSAIQLALSFSYQFLLPCPCLCIIIFEPESLVKVFHRNLQLPKRVIAQSHIMEGDMVFATRCNGYAVESDCVFVHAKAIVQSPHLFVKVDERKSTPLETSTYLECHIFILVKYEVIGPYVREVST